MRNFGCFECRALEDPELAAVQSLDASATFAHRPTVFPKAEQAFAAAVAADPAYPEALDNLGAVVERRGAWDRAAALDRPPIPVSALARYHPGRILANQRRFAEAISEFEKSVVEPVDAQSPGYLYALGATHARAG